MREIINQYTKGEMTLEAANAALAEAGAGYSLQPGRNALTEEELRQTTVGHYPDQANGYGLLDTGTGTLDKVHVAGGVLDHAVNTVMDNGEPNMAASVTIAGKTYWAYGDKLIERESHVTEAEDLPVKPDMARRKEFAGTVQTQRTKAGRFEVTYDAQGYAVKAARV